MAIADPAAEKTSGGAGGVVFPSGMFPLSAMNVTP